MPPVRLRLCLLLLCCLAAPAQAASLRGQLQSLARQNGVVLEGLDVVGAEPARPAAGDLARQFQTLLADYNFMLVGAGGKVERVAITSLKRPQPRPRLSGAVPTQRLGTHHQVQAILAGPNGAETAAGLLIDTGATTVVLPTSMMAALGFKPEDLRTASSQTAAGVVPVQIGLLQSVSVGGVRAENVQVGFIDDRKLNGVRLLGMSFLNRFRFSLDDAANELQLQAK